MAHPGKRLTVDERISMRNKQQVNAGKEAGWSDYALDCYLDGTSVKEITETFGVSTKVFYNAIAKAALYRLMKAANCEHLDDMKELTDGCGLQQEIAPSK